MTKQITFDITCTPWSCECCGYGQHIEINIPELNKTFSMNDQFGDKLNKTHDDLPYNDNYGHPETYIDIETLTEYYEKQGYKVILNDT